VGGCWIKLYDLVTVNAFEFRGFEPANLDEVFWPSFWALLS